MLSCHAFRGKNDHELKRLNQYKLLEKRKTDELTAGSDVRDFLRASNIHVTLEFDVDRHRGRIVELINRTNQLNFTKRRFSESPEKASIELQHILGSYSFQSALVRVTDRYGDHGFCGFYAHNSDDRELWHFCFSCRILGMGVEKWLYDKLGKPTIYVQGEVLTDLFGETEKIDWINQDTEKGFVDRTALSQHLDIDRIVARGPCGLGAITHYFNVMFPLSYAEYNVVRNSTPYHIEHSALLRQAIDGLSAEAFDVAERLGFIRADFQTRLFDQNIKSQAVVLDFTVESHCALFRHRGTGLTVPFEIPGIPHHVDLTKVEPSDIPANTRTPRAIKMLRFSARRIRISRSYF